MPRYIDADKLEKDGWMLVRTYSINPQDMCYESKSIDEIPTADVRENVRGEWIKDLFYLPTCSRCGGKTYGLHAFDAVLSDFCPHCGCSMKREEDNND